MQTKNPLFDDLAQLMTNAMGAAQGVSEEMQAVMRGQAERFVAEMDLVRRDEFDALKDENDALRARIEALETALAANARTVD